MRTTDRTWLFAWQWTGSSFILAPVHLISSVKITEISTDYMKNLTDCCDERFRKPKACAHKSSVFRIVKAICIESFFCREREKGLRGHNCYHRELLLLREKGTKKSQLLSSRTAFAIMMSSWPVSQPEQWDCPAVEKQTRISSLAKTFEVPAVHLKHQLLSTADVFKLWWMSWNWRSYSLNMYLSRTHLNYPHEKP